MRQETLKRIKERQEMEPGVMEPAWNPSSQQVEAEGREFKVSLCYIAKSWPIWAA